MHNSMQYYKCNSAFLCTLSLPQFNSIRKQIRMDFFETVTHSSVDKLLDSFHLAAENHNLEDYFGCFHRNGTFLGSDATEHWTVDKFLEFSRPYFLSGKGSIISLDTASTKTY